MTEVFAADLGLFSWQRFETQISLRVSARTVAGKKMPEMVATALMAPLANQDLKAALLGQKKTAGSLRFPARA